TPQLSTLSLHDALPISGHFRASPELRQVVELKQLNLHAASWPVSGTFDLIFCRNVLIYFNVESKAAVIQRLTERLAPGGYLFLRSEEHTSELQSLRHLV